MILIFLTRNILRINTEMDQYKFNFYKNASYNKIFENHNHYKNILNIKNCYIDKACLKTDILMLKKFNKDIFYRKK